MIAIIGAMPQEVNELLPYFPNMQTEQLKSRTLYHNDDVVIALSGIGKVDAAYTTTLLLNHYDIDLIINIGSAGGLKENQNIGDLVIASELRYHDYILDINKPDFGSNKIFKPSPKLISIAEEVLTELDLRHHLGQGVSGDQFITSQSQVESIVKHFPNALFCEMEATAIAHVATLFDTEYIILRGLSDIAIREGNDVDFDAYLELAAKQSAHLCFNFINRYRS